MGLVLVGHKDGHARAMVAHAGRHTRPLSADAFEGPWVPGQRDPYHGRLTAGYDVTVAPGSGEPACYSRRAA